MKPQPSEDYLNNLLNLADEAATAAAKSSNFPKIIDFPLPKEIETNDDESFQYEDTMILQESSMKGGGLGMFAKQNLKAGTVLLVSKPLAIVMDWEDENEYDDDTDNSKEEEEDDVSFKYADGLGTKRNGILVLRLLQNIKEDPSVWFDKLSCLFPRNAEDCQNLPEWICEDSNVTDQIEKALLDVNLVLVLKMTMMQTSSFDEHKDDALQEVTNIRRRLPLIVKYNCYSVETSPELFVYPNQALGGYTSLSGTALYLTPSYFNHGHRPNVARWSIGDIFFFVTNQDIKHDDELFISYIESELLCESSEKRTQMLDMDFTDDADYFNQNKIAKSNEKHRSELVVNGPVINPDVQEAIMAMPPMDRIEEIHDLLNQASAATTLSPTGITIAEESEQEEDLAWFHCDEHQLRILLALTFDSLGHSEEALEQWGKCVIFGEQHLPTNDENNIVILVQAALTAYSLGNRMSAKKYASKALDMHTLIFGHGTEWFHRRYRKEFTLKLRPQSDVISDTSLLWPTS